MHYNTPRYELALNVIAELKLKDYAKLLADNLFKIDDTLRAKTVLILKDLNALDFVSKDILGDIQNENVKMLVQSCII